MKKTTLVFLMLSLLMLQAVNADDAVFRLVVSRNDKTAGGQFHADLQIQINSGTSPRTLNSMTADIYYTPQLNEWSTSFPGDGWALGTSDGYSRSVNKNSGYYRVLVTGNGVGQDSPGNPAGWSVTTSWQNIVTLRWTIATATSVNITIADNTDAAAYFDNFNNNPQGDVTNWNVSNQDLGDVSLPVELTTYSAQCTAEGVLLEWITESEVENAGFILERRISNEPDWTMLASYKTHDALKGQGNTNIRTNYMFTDQNVYAGDLLYYRLSNVSTQGVQTVDDILSITVTDLVTPQKTALSRAYPNPFNPKSKISYQLSQAAWVTLKVIDIRGRTIQTIVRGTHQQAGNYHYFWNGKNNTGRPVSSGVYILLLNVGDIVQTQKVMLVR